MAELATRSRLIAISRRFRRAPWTCRAPFLRAGARGDPGPGCVPPVTPPLQPSLHEAAYFGGRSLQSSASGPPQLPAATAPTDPHRVRGWTGWPPYLTAGLPGDRIHVPVGTAGPAAGRSRAAPRVPPRACLEPEFSARLAVRTAAPAGSWSAYPRTSAESLFWRVTPACSRPGHPLQHHRPARTELCEGPANGFLATTIDSFITLVSNVCDVGGADVMTLRTLLGPRHTHSGAASFPPARLRRGCLSKERAFWPAPTDSLAGRRLHSSAR